MDVNRVLVFKSVDARKQNAQNKPGNFTMKFTPELNLEPNKQYYIVHVLPLSFEITNLLLPYSGLILCQLAVIER